MVEVFNRGAFGSKAHAMESARVMVGNQNVTGFTIETDGAENAISVVGALNNKAKVDGNPLIALSGGAGIFFVTGGALEFGVLADRAVVKITGGSEFGNAVCIQMGLPSTTVVEMAKTLVPENAELVTAEVAEPIGGGLIELLVDRGEGRWIGWHIRRVGGRATIAAEIGDARGTGR